MTEPLIRIVVRGTPGTAGSKSAFPIWRNDPVTGRREFVKTVQVEKDIRKVKQDWRTAVMAAAANLIVDDGGRIRSPYPLDEALVCSMVFTVAKPASAPKTRRVWPDKRPDALKYARATEDALQAAGVLKDDGRIVRYTELAKSYPHEHEHALEVPGVVILLWRAIDLVGVPSAPVPAGAPPALFDPTPETDPPFMF
jgi:Holliday junction resolvase RusA-like endonuclease